MMRRVAAQSPAAMAHAYAEMKEQRDELLAALERICNGNVMREQGLSEGQYTSGDVLVEYQNIARNAIARATAK